LSKLTSQKDITKREWYELSTNDKKRNKNDRESYMVVGSWINSKIRSNDRRHLERSRDKAKLKKWHREMWRHQSVWLTRTTGRNEDELFWPSDLTHHKIDNK
jgi:hypothetical protein